ncbi:MAG: UbiA family prenyltransferase [Paracoccaceae bacterium]
MLVVDLDRSLVRTDLLHENLIAALAADPQATLWALLRLADGKAAFKARLADIVRPDIPSLPFEPAVIAEIEAARATGERVALVSASDRRLVQAVADHLGLFDEAHGSDGTRNLGGAEKAAFLVERFGARGFAYVGDHPKDVAVWEHSARAVTVGAPPALRTAAERAAPEATHLAPPAVGLARARPYVKALRPHQWLKNLLIFLPLLAAHSLAPGAWWAAALAFLCFSLTASSAYVLNDLLDLSADRAHPRKSRRPFASGAVPVMHGLIMAPGLLIAAFGIAAIGEPWPFLVVLLGYFVLTVAYSFVLKRRLIIDIVTLAVLYTVRVIAGAAAAGVALSPWMLGFSGFLFLALAAIKRQAELVDGVRRGKVRASGRAYHVDDLPVVTMMAVGAAYTAALVFALYINSEAVVALYRAPEALWLAMPVLIYWISRAILLAHRGEMPDDPVLFAVKDRVSLGCGALVLAAGLVATLGLGP